MDMLYLKRKLNQAFLIAGCIVISITEIMEDQVCLTISVDEGTSIERYRNALEQIFKTEEGHFDSCETIPDPQSVNVPYQHSLDLTEHVSILVFGSNDDYVKCGVQAPDDRLIHLHEVWHAIRRDR